MKTLHPFRSLMALRLLFVCLLWLVAPHRMLAAQLKLGLPLNRTAYQCNERIDVSVLRSSSEALPAGELTLALAGEDGSRLSFVFPVNPVEAGTGPAQTVEHLHVNGWLLRPGSYTVEVVGDGTNARTNISVYSHIRRSPFKLINWGRAKGAEQLREGEDNLGFNLFYGQSASDEEANFIRAGVDFMACCVMSGGHQMDLRQECDWSDPYVIRGGTRRVVKRAFIDRTRPNVWGVHFYDEPGLTWAKDPQTGVMTPHAVPWQWRQYDAAFGQPPFDWKNVDPGNPEHAARWAQWARWKLSLMDAAWKDAQFGVNQVRPDYVSVTQSQYGYSAFSDGYYFNVVRSLPVISGHGGYHDFGPGCFNPSQFLEFARARDLTRPNWYLPTWFGNTTPDEFRLEQYLSFQCNLQGMMSPPDLEPAQPAKSKAAQGVVESNHLMARLGTVFATMPVTRPPVALLFSLSQMIHAQTLDRKVCYAHDTTHGRNVMFTYLAGKLLQHQFMPVLDEDVLDGTLAAQHKAIILTSIEYLDANVVAALEDFAKNRGLVLLTVDCTVKINGAVKLEAAPAWPDAAKIAELKKAGKVSEANNLMKMRQALAGAQRLAEAIRSPLEKAGIKPPLTSSEPGIVVTRQAVGDVEYLFAVNATHESEGDPMLGIKAVTATLGLPDDGRLVYDAVHGGAIKEFARKGNQLEGRIRFGPGQMRVFARTTRSIGGIRVGTPVLHRDYTLQESPLRLDLAANVLSAGVGASARQPETRWDLLSGSVPLRVRVTDSLGATRYDLYRATDRGTLNLTLPLALNDPPGEWRVTVTELLANTSDTATFILPETTTCVAAAGASWRAVSWPEDRDNIFRFFRAHQAVTVVKGSADFHAATAERLTKILEPWNVRCTTVSAAEVNQPRKLSEAEAATWIGLDFAGHGQIKPGDKNSPVMAGFAIPGPVILLGTPEDNPLIKLLADQRFLPYQPSLATMPGRGRGYVAWQRDGIGVNQESLTLIAYDANGLSEAVGTVYEMLAGLEPLTPLAMPRRSSLTPASRANIAPEIAIEWTTVLPDRVEGLRATGDTVSALTHDGTLAELKSNGQIASQKILPAADRQQLAQELRTSADANALAAAEKASAPTRVVKFAATNGGHLAVAYWGGTVSVFDASGTLQSTRRFPQDITALKWSGPWLLAGDADGRLMALRVP